MRSGEDTAGGCGLCRLNWFLSCKDTDVAKKLRSRCEPVIKRWLLSSHALGGRMANGRAGDWAAKEPVIALRVLAFAFANFEE
jgi:hypothetical protein